MVRRRSPKPWNLPGARAALSSACDQPVAPMYRSERTIEEGETRDPVMGKAGDPPSHISPQGEPGERKACRCVRPVRSGPPLQLHLSFACERLRHGLMRSSPDGPGDHEGRLDPALLEARGHAADFLDRPAHQRCSLASSLLFWGERRLVGALAHHRHHGKGQHHQ